jgi:hypothetical protein
MRTTSAVSMGVIAAVHLAAAAVAGHMAMQGYGSRRSIRTRSLDMTSAVRYGPFIASQQHILL